MDQRIGFACKIVPSQSFDTKREETAWLQTYNTRSTTVTALNRLGRTQAIERIAGLIRANAEVLCNQFAMAATWPQALRMIRIGSEIMPARTHPDWMSAYEDEPVIRESLGSLARAGELARQWDIRLSTHPAQFTMLVSQDPAVVDRAIDDLHYHSEIFRLMGYTSSDQRQEINIHGGGRHPEFHTMWLANWRRLAPDTRQWLSIENDEFSYCLDDILPLAEHAKICLDINHYWIHQGHYLDPADPRLDAVIASWRGARPEMHVAWPAETTLPAHDPNLLPDFATLESQGHKRARLRAHSDGAWNQALNQYALQFWDRFDLMVEAKRKNLAARQLFEAAGNKQAV